jgi:DNA-binding IclR family transcriptional regulator
MRDAIRTTASSRKTIDKAMSLLTVFSHQQPELSVTDLAEILKMDKSIISRLASSLRTWGMLEKNPTTGRLRIGSTAMKIGALFSQRNTMMELSMPVLADLVNQTGHSAHLSILDGLNILVVSTVESPNTLRVIMRVGEQRELHATAAGKLFLALSPPALLDSAYKGTGFKPQTAMTIVSREDLQKGFAKIRKDGIAINRGESTLGAGAIAAPILDKENKVLSAISTVFPLNIVDVQQWVKIEKQTQSAANKLSKRLMEEKF